MKAIRLPKRMTTGIAFADGQKPFHDRRCWKLILSFIAEYKPTFIFNLGDDAECYHWSRWTKSHYTKPSYMRSWNPQAEIEAVQAEWRAVKDASPRSKRIYICGNHEARISRNKLAKDPITEVPTDNFVDLFRAGDYWHEIVGRHGDGLRIGKLRMTHGTRTNIYSAKSTLNDWGANVLFGHTHRLDFWPHKDKTGQVRCAWGVGCHCRLDPHYTEKPNWMHGMAFLKFARNGWFSVQVIPIINYRFVFGQKLYEG